MEAVMEVTVWSGATQPNHSYLFDGNKMLAYIKKGESSPHYFKEPITISKSGRKFTKLPVNPFKQLKQKDTVITVAGSKGAIYSIDTESKTCTCQGYTFRGTCKHLIAIG